METTMETAGTGDTVGTGDAAGIGACRVLERRRALRLHQRSRWVGHRFHLHLGFRGKDSDRNRD